MIETHPFGDFVPPNARYLILGSFTGRQAVKGKHYTDDAYDWFYGTKTNQFWPILAEVYGIELSNKQEKQALFTQLHMAMADIIYQCERVEGNNLDGNLKKIIYSSTVVKIQEYNPIEKIFFTSFTIDIIH